MLLEIFSALVEHKVRLTETKLNNKNIDRIREIQLFLGCNNIELQKKTIKSSNLLINFLFFLVFCYKTKVSIAPIVIYKVNIFTMLFTKL